MRLQGLVACAVAAAVSGCGAGDPAASGLTAGDACAYRDTKVGVRVSHPCNWTRPDAPLTHSVDPREAVALATYPVHGGTRGGPCVA
ncbi:MAG: hypothetical protein H0V68_10600, partial [Actinobacteria bacterium]|nr:hypothetical protein [Actinomycetota bacterium]